MCTAEYQVNRRQLVSIIVPAYELSAVFAFCQDQNAFTEPTCQCLLLQILYCTVLYCTAVYVAVLEYIHTYIYICILLIFLCSRKHIILVSRHIKCWNLCIWETLFASLCFRLEDTFSLVLYAGKRERSCSILIIKKVCCHIRFCKMWEKSVKNTGIFSNKKQNTIVSFFWRGGTSGKENARVFAG